jgi:cyanate permease
MILGWVFLPFVYAELQIPAQQSSVLMALLGISAAVFAFIVPGLSDKLGRKPVVVVFSLIGVLYPLAVLNYTGSPWLLGAIIFIGWSASGVFPIFMATIPSETIPSKYVATSLGLIVGVGEVVGGGFGAPLAGKLGDLYGPMAPMYMAMVCAVMGALLALGLKETAPVKVGARKLAPA